MYVKYCIMGCTLRGLKGIQTHPSPNLHKHYGDETSDTLPGENRPITITDVVSRDFRKLRLRHSKHLQYCRARVGDIGKRIPQECEVFDYDED